MAQRPDRKRLGKKHRDASTRPKKGRAPRVTPTTGAVDPRKVLGTYSYQHPVFGSAAIAAQRRRGEISGANRTYYCGAYWGYGFHEDGVNSALASLSEFRRRQTHHPRAPHEQLHLQRVG